MPKTLDAPALRERMEKLDTERSQVKAQLDRSRLLTATGSVIDTITSPEFIEKMQKAREAAGQDDGLDTVAKLLSLDGLRRAGAEIPDDFRLTSRVFEDKVEGVRLEVHPRRIGPIDGTLSWGACAGAGGLTFCGCGGFST